MARVSNAAITWALLHFAGSTLALQTQDPVTCVGCRNWADSLAYVGILDPSDPKPAIAVAGHRSGAKSHIVFLNRDGSEASALRKTIPAPSPGATYDNSAIASGDITGMGVKFVILGAYHGNHIYPYSLGADGTATNQPAISKSDLGIPSYGGEDRWGYSLTVKDVNGDGIDDILVCAQGGAFPTGPPGTVFGFVTVLFMGKPDVSAPLVPIVNHTATILSTDVDPSIARADAFGTSIAPMGDIDGDGVLEYAVGGNKKVWILSIDSMGNLTRSQEIHAADLNSILGFDFGVSGAGFGYDVAAADVDGDGIPELLVGAPSFDVNKGAVVFLFFNKTWSVRDAQFIQPHPDWNVAIRFGSSVTFLDHIDLNCNMFPEIAVGCSSGNSGGADSHVVIFDDVYVFGDSNGDGYSDFVEKHMLKRREHALLGPVDAPDLLGGASLSDDDPGDGRKWGFNPGRTFGFGGISLSKFSELEWRMDYASLALDGFILDDGVYSELLGTEQNPCHRSCGDTNGTIAVCPGSTRIFNAPGNSFQAVNTSLSLSLADATFISFNPPTVNVMDTDGFFSVNVLFAVEDPSQVGNWTPALAFFDAYETPATDEGKAISGFSSGFYFDPVQEMSVDEHHIEIIETVGQCCSAIENQLNLIPTDSPPSVGEIQDGLPKLQDIQGLPTLNEIQGVVDASLSNFDYDRLESMGERVMNATRDVSDLEICLWVADLWPDPLGNVVPDPCHPDMRAAIDNMALPTTYSIAQDLNALQQNVTDCCYETRVLQQELNDSIAEACAEIEDQINNVHRHLNGSIAETRTEMEDEFTEVRAAQHLLNKSIDEIRTEMDVKFSLVFDMLIKMNKSISEIHNEVLKFKDKPKRRRKGDA